MGPVTGCSSGEVTTVPLGEAKDRLSEYVSDVERTHDRVTITRHGRTAAVLISADDLAALEETVDILTVHGALSAIAERAGISKPAVLYHFASKDKVIEATLEHVYTGVTTTVGGRVERAGDPVGMLTAYLRGLMEYMRTTRRTSACWRSPSAARSTASLRTGSPIRAWTSTPRPTSSRRRSCSRAC